MYKVFVQQSEILIRKKADDLSQFQHVLYCVDSPPDWTIVKKWVKQYPGETLVLAADAPKACWKKLRTRFRIIVAAGGLVINSKGEFLMIKRLGLWDLPKGKLERGEDIVDCAIREVEEECQVFGLGVTGHICTTYHVMRRDKNKYLKESRWYMMRTNQTAGGIPQKEEGIEKVKWVTKSELKKKLNKSWPSILEVFLQADITI
jgi:ADP-ribose pyrophosphatase YjhB (NUDIX family)